MAEPSTPHPADARLLWAAAGVLLLAGALLASELRGRTARLLYAAPPGQPRVFLAEDAAGAARLWAEAGIRGRRLITFTGQWTRPPPAQGATLLLGTRESWDQLDARNALFLAARLGMVRRLEVVMPAALVAGRLAELRGRREVVPEPGGFRQPYEALDRRFSTAEALRVPGEPVLVLVEPSWFAQAAPLDPLAWLRARGVSWDLAVIALSDPAASGEARLAAAAYGSAAGAAAAGSLR